MLYATACYLFKTLCGYVMTLVNNQVSELAYNIVHDALPAKTMDQCNVQHATDFALPLQSGQ